MSQSTKKTRVVNIDKEPFDVYIGRRSQWGNPYPIQFNRTREQSLALFREYVTSRPELIKHARRQLKGLTLGCHCKPLACHGDIWVELVEES